MLYDVAAGTMTFSETEQKNHTYLLADATYSVKDLQKLTKYLMHCLMIHVIEHDTDRKHEFSDPENDFLLPFGMVFAAIDGNLFHNFKEQANQDHSLAVYYNNDAFCQLASNQVDVHDLIKCIMFAYNSIKSLDIKKLNDMMVEQTQYANDYKYPED
jgi:hypothetical protein